VPRALLPIRSALSLQVVGTHFWIEIRAWSHDGRSRLLWYGQIETWERLKILQETYKVEPRKTQIDCGYRKDDVFKHCAKYGWLALGGDQRDSYPHKTRDGRTIYKPYSRYQAVMSSDGKKTMVSYFSNLAIKDILHQLRNGKGVSWEIPDDVGNDYLQQIDAEVRRGEGKSAIWKPRRRDVLISILHPIRKFLITWKIFFITFLLIPFIPNILVERLPSLKALCQN